MGIEIPGWTGQLVIALPYLLLALVLLAFLRRRVERPEPRLPGDIGRDGVPAGPQPGWDGVAAPATAPRVVAPPRLPASPQAPIPKPSAKIPEGAAAAKPPALPARPAAAPAPAVVSPAAAPAAPPVPAAPSAPAGPPPPQTASATAPTVPSPAAASAPALPAQGDAPAAAEAKPKPPRPPSLAEIENTLARAEAAGRDNDVALISLYLARRRKAEGVPDYIEGIRRCIRLAAQLGLKELHGEARLDLGDEARAAGDLTTACEHWQIARSLFEDAKLPAKRDNAEARMKRFGCPTDWVLNDF